eukprot:jgi/Tetstr1/439549/TSEL_027978.t1
MRKNAKANLFNIFLNGYLGLFATHGSQHLVNPSSEVKILSLMTLNARVARYIGDRQNVTNANTTMNTQLDNFRLLRKEYEMLREIDDKRLEGEGDEEEFSYKRWSSESKDDRVTDPVMKEKYSRFSYLWKSCVFALKRNPENGQLGQPSNVALFKATVMRKYDIWKAIEELMAAFQSGSLEMPEQGSILKLLEGLNKKSATKPVDKKDAFIIRECNMIFKSRCLDRGYMHFTKKLALQAGIDCYPPDSEEADQSLKPHFPEQVLKELTATSHSRHIIIKGDFDNDRDNIKQLEASTAKPVSLLIADSNFGLNLGPWDVAWTSEFKNTLSLVDPCNDGLQNCKFIWFLTDQALPHAMAAISERDMQYKLFY